MHITKILVPSDFSPGSYAALEKAAELAKTLHAAIDLMHVRHGDEQEDPLMDVMASWLARKGFTPGTRFEYGDPATVILRTAVEEGYDLIAMGTRGAGNSRGALGSVAAKVVSSSPVPVLTMRIEPPGLSLGASARPT